MGNLSETKKYKLRLEIQGLPRTMNSFRWLARNYAIEKRRWEYAIIHALLKTNQQKPPTPLKKALVKYTLYSTKPRDEDNLHSSFKIIQDQLVRIGILLDDSPSVIGKPIALHEKAKPRDGKVLIEIEEID